MRHIPYDSNSSVIINRAKEVVAVNLAIKFTDLKLLRSVDKEELENFNWNLTPFHPDSFISEATEKLIDALALQYALVENEKDIFWKWETLLRKIRDRTDNPIRFGLKEASFAILDDILPGPEGSVILRFKIPQEAYKEKEVVA